MVRHASTHGRFTARGAHHPLCSSLPLSLSSSLSPVSVNVCHSLCYFLSSAPAAHVSIGLPCCLSLNLSVCVSVCLFLCVCSSDDDHQSCCRRVIPVYYNLDLTFIVLATVSTCYDNTVPTKVIVEIRTHSNIASTLAADKSNRKCTQIVGAVITLHRIGKQFAPKTLTVNPVSYKLHLYTTNWFAS